MKGYTFKKNNKFNKKFKKKGFVYLNNETINDEMKKIRYIVKSIYVETDEYYTKISYNEFYLLNIKTLEKIKKSINIKKFQQKCVNLVKKKLSISEKFKFSSFISLLITRPSKNKADIDEAEFVGLHRENFYGDPKYMNYQINLWFPIFDINKLQNFKFIEGSEKIPDEKIKFIKKRNLYVKKHSNAHKCGINYAPKKIISGVSISKAKRFNIPKNSFLVFNSNLVHGDGKNLTNKIRFAFGFGVVGQKHFKNIKIPINFRSGKPHYIT